MSYREINILRNYKTNKNDIVRDFYNPVLKNSVLYKRAVGFFSSTALIEMAKGISGLIQNGGKIKFIVSPILSDEDVEAISKGYDERKLVENALMREFKEPQNHSDKERLNWLAHLISSGRMEIKVAFTSPQHKTGMYHEKIGVMYDTEGNRISFTGSLNETANAFYNNFESIVVFNSLISDDKQRVYDIEYDFSYYPYSDQIIISNDDNLIISYECYTNMCYSSLKTETNNCSDDYFSLITRYIDGN